MAVDQVEFLIVASRVRMPWASQILCSLGEWEGIDPKARDVGDLSHLWTYPSARSTRRDAERNHKTFFLSDPSREPGKRAA